MPENNDPFQPWNNSMHADNPFAPHNGFDKDNPFKPWNQPFGKVEQLSCEDQEKYGRRCSREDSCDEGEW